MKRTHRAKVAICPVNSLYTSKHDIEFCRRKISARPCSCDALALVRVDVDALSADEMMRSAAQDASASSLPRLTRMMSPSWSTYVRSLSMRSTSGFLRALSERSAGSLGLASCFCAGLPYPSDQGAVGCAGEG